MRNVWLTVCFCPEEGKQHSTTLSIGCVASAKQNRNNGNGVPQYQCTISSQRILFACIRKPMVIEIFKDIALICSFQSGVFSI